MPQLTTLIPSFTAPVTDRVWLVGAHGGAGCTTIRHSDPERFADAGRALPVSPDPSMPSRVILCAMGTGRGLESLRALLADHSHRCNVNDPSSCSSYMTVSSSAILKLDVLGERGGRVVFVFDPPCRVVHPQHLSA